MVQFLVAHEALAVRWLRHLANFDYFFEVCFLFNLVLGFFVHVDAVGCVLEAKVKDFRRLGISVGSCFLNRFFQVTHHLQKVRHLHNAAIQVVQFVTLAGLSAFGHYFF